MNRLFSVILVPFILLCTLTPGVYAQELNGSSAISSQELLPASTKAWFSIPDSAELEQKFLSTQLGQIASEEKLAPFMESLKGQFREWMSEQNVRLGIDLESISDVRSGEICIAGILPNQNAEVSPRFSRDRLAGRRVRQRS